MRVDASRASWMDWLAAAMLAAWSSFFKPFLLDGGAGDVERERPLPRDSGKLFVGVLLMLSLSCGKHA